jgi:hypothetical protein
MTLEAKALYAGVVNLLALPLDQANFFVKRPRLISESFSANRSLPVELGVVSPGGGTILSFILECSQVILLASVSLPGYLVNLSG